MSHNEKEIYQVSYFMSISMNRKKNINYNFSPTKRKVIN